jgi:hypothetical protein
MARFFFFLVNILIFNFITAFGQDYIKNIIITSDSSSYSSDSCVLIDNDKFIAFKYYSDDEIVEIKLFPKNDSVINRLELIPNNEYNLVDSIINFNNEYYLFHIKFSNLTTSNFLALRFKIKTDSIANIIEEIKLLPYTTTSLGFYTTDNELFIGEEKIFELISNKPENIKIPSDWIIGKDFDYRVKLINKQLLLHLVPKTLGTNKLTLKLSTIKPDLSSNRRPKYETSELNILLIVKTGKLAFLTLDNKDFSLDDNSKRDGVEIQIDQNRDLLLQRTYRIEEQEAPGGALIAELFTRQYLNNNKVLCRLRVYNLHKPSDCYLYIKDVDDAKFVTNFSITPKTNIQSISILRNGVEWVENNQVFPGESINLRIEGEGMHKANLRFEGIENVVQDSIVRTERVIEFKITIPVYISKKKIFIYNSGENTGKFLQIREFQEPCPLDFIAINYGKGDVDIANCPGSDFYNETVKDINISFDPFKIDSLNKFYGKQYIDISVKVTGNKGELVELLNLPNVVVCPGENSTRHTYYDLKDCAKEDINLNNLLDHKTYDYEDWTKIKLTFKHSKDKYTSPGMEKNIEIILQRKTRFDIDVSFPSLLTKVMKDEGWQNGLSISMAIIAQLSFYEKNKIARFMPYRIGAGFLALNAFNFSETNITRDLGIVVIGSLSPTRRDTKFSFPLYAGGGYLLNKKSWFWLVGPGIRVSF